MNLVIRGLGTAVPSETMSQQQALDLAIAVCPMDARQRRLVEVLYRKAGVQNRHTCLPHRIALRWVGVDESSVDGVADTTPTPQSPARAATAPDKSAALLVESEPSWGPTMMERTEFYEQHAFPLAREACAAALADARAVETDVTHLVTVSCTGFSAPGVDVHLINAFGLAPTTQRVHVGFMGCHGALNGLRVAQGLVAVDPQAVVLLCAVELCSLHYRFQYDPERFLGNALFADGAAAVVLGGRTAAPDSAPDLTESEPRVADASAAPQSDSTVVPSVVATGSCLIPESCDAMTWRVGDHGFEMTLAATVPDRIREHLRVWLTDWLGKHGLSLESIAHWIVHPGGPRILHAVEQALRLDAAALADSRAVLAQFGNMSSPTVLFIYERLCRRGLSGPAVMLGFGPGLVAEAAILV